MGLDSPESIAVNQDSRRTRVSAYSNDFTISSTAKRLKWADFSIYHVAYYSHSTRLRTGN